MTGVWPLLRSSMASPYLYSTPIAWQTIGKGHLWALRTASFARALSPCGRPRARLLGPGQSDFGRDLHSVGKRCAGIVLRGCLTEKSLVKIGASSRTTRFASKRGEFSPNGVAIWIFGSDSGGVLRGCLTEKSLVKIGASSRTTRFASKRGEFCQTGSQSGYSGSNSGGVLRGCLTEKSLVKIGGPLTRGDLPLREGSFRQTGRNLDIRLGSCEGITDPWPTPSAAVRRSAQGQARGSSP